jgi:NTP pyrophosphatase (non-canonical NTP hydrolase)
MKDTITTINDLKAIVKKYSEDRDWQQYYSPKNVSMQIATEAAELMELFLWVESKESFAEAEKRREAVEHEIADIAYGLINFCNQTNIDLAAAFEKKMIHNAQKYPIEKAKGKRLKYTQL